MSNKLHPMVSRILNDVKESGVYTKPRVDYYEFREHWLALFSAASSGNLAPLGDWIQNKCAGNGFLEVEVIKGGTPVPDEDRWGQTTYVGGELMFTVPAILNNNIKVKLKNGKDIAKATIHANELGKRIAVAGENYQQKHVVEALQIETDDPNSLSSRMDKIFEHFGVKRVKSMEVSTEETIPTEENPELRTSNDMLDFGF